MEGSNLTAWLQLGQTTPEGNFAPFPIKSVELQSVSYALVRGIDNLGKIATDLRGGNISFLSTRIPSAGFLQWGLRSDRFYSGVISFCNPSGQSVQRLSFEHAAMVNLKIVFENEGSGYFYIQATAQAQTLILQGAAPFTNYWKREVLDSVYSADSEAAGYKGNFFGVELNPEVSLTGYFELGSNVYDMRGFEIEFNQEVDPKDCEPQTSVRGGYPTISLFSLPDGNINKWMRGSEPLSGFFRFGAADQGYPLKISFENARCAGYFSQCTDGADQNIICRIMMAPEKIAINGVEYRTYNL